MTVYPLHLSSKDGKFNNVCYVIHNSDSNHALLIDPSWDSETYENLFEKLGVNSISIFLTHRHIDHRDLVPYFTRVYNSPVYISREESEFYNYTCDNQIMIDGESDIEIESYLIKPILMPGHTVGCISYLVGDNLFTGDTLFNESAGTCACKGGDSTQMFHSFKHLKSLIHDSTKIWPGHEYKAPVGKPFKEVTELNRFLRIEEEELFVSLRDRLDRTMIVSQ
jgi:hydroxyacylglutathione hydrolase